MNAEGMAQKGKARGDRAVKRGKRWTEAEAREVLERAEKSGKSLWRYARENGLNGQRLHWWKSRLAKPKAGPTPTRPGAPRLAPVILTGGMRTGTVAAVVRIGDAEIDVLDPAKIGGVWLREVAKALGARR